MTVQFELDRPEIRLKHGEDEIVLTTSLTVARGIGQLRQWEARYPKPPFHATGEVMFHTPDSPIMWHHFTLNTNKAEADPFNDVEYIHGVDNSFRYNVCRDAMTFLAGRAEESELVFSAGLPFVKNMWVKVAPKEVQ